MAVQVDRLEQCLNRCRRLELRDEERARELIRSRAKTKAWQRQANEQRARADEAEKQARQFHALLLQERIRKL